MKTFLRTLWAVALVGCGLVLAAGAQPRVVTVGVASNFSEAHEYTFNPFQHSFEHGMAMALDESRAALRKKGYEIVLQNFDYGANVINVRNAAQQAIQSDAVAVIGYSGSSQTLLAAPLHEQHQLTMIAPTSTATQIYSAGQYIVPLAIPNDTMARMMAEAAVTRGGKRALLVYAIDRPYAVDLAQTFTTHYQSRGGTIVREFTVLNDQVDFSAMLSQLEDLAVDVVIVPNHEFSSARVIAALSKAGVTVPFIGGDGWESGDGKGFFKIVRNPQFEGYFVTDWHADMQHDGSKAFAAKYTKRFNEAPNDEALLYYDAMRLLVRAILAAPEPTRELVHREIRKIRTFAGTSGTVELAAMQLTKRNAVLVHMNTKRQSLDFINTLHTERSP